MSTGWLQCGFIELAASKHRLSEFRRVSAFGRLHGVDVHEISPREVQQLFPLCRTDDIEAGFYVKEDGRANPVDVTMSLGKGARMHGAKFFQNVRVTGVRSENGAVKGVEIEGGGFIEAEYVVNCAGMWARQLGERNGVAIPNQAAEHYYLVTEAIPEVDPSWPVVEDPSSYTYVRPEGNGLMVGLFEPRAAAWNVGEIPAGFSFGSISPDWDRMTPFLDKAMHRVPRTLTAGIKTFFCGPESFTPDLAPIIGEAPEMRNYFVAAGLNSIGILTGGGVGRLVAHWIVHGEPDMDVTGISIERLQQYQTTPQYRSHRVVESLGMVYKCHYPSHAMKTARNVKRSPLHERLASQRAYFRDVSGWESPGWYAPEGVQPLVDEGKRTGYWERENWFPYWQREHEACRSTAALIDMSFMSKFMVEGKDAGKILNWMSTADVDGETGRITYTQWLTPSGLLDADLTVVKLAADKLMVIATDTVHRHVQTRIQREIEAAGARAHVFDVTNAYAQINIQGPRSRELLQRLTNTDISDAAYPFRTARHIDIGYSWVLCSRITYVGELGYELFVPTEHAVGVYDHILAVEKEHPVGLMHVGLRALGSLRMEKGYRDYGHDLDNTDNIISAGLSFTCDFEKPGGFIGKEAVLREKASPRHANSKLVQVLLRDPQPLLYHGEVLYRDGVRMGSIRSASYGHTLGGSVGLAMANAPAGTVFNKTYIDSGKWELEVDDRLVPATVSLRPLFDPSNSRIKA